MSTGPPLAKIAPPRLPEVYARERLFERLDEAVSRPVLWIGGPPGSGKTTLAASYLQARRRSHIWYQVDPGDADPATFFHYVGLAAKRAAPRRKLRIPHLTPEYLLGLPAFTRRFFEKVYDCLKPPACLVFDNFQEVEREGLFHRVIAEALAAVPEGVNVLVVSRNDPPAALSRLRANRVMAQIGWEDLRLTEEEAVGIAELAARGGTDGHNAEAVRALNRRADGWAAGLVLLLEGAKKEGRTPLTAGEPVRAAMFEYLATELFERQKPAVRDVLMNVSFLPQMSDATVVKLTGNPQAGSILGRLAREHLLTYRQAERRPLYQFHPLFREFLLARAHEGFSPDRLRDVQVRAADLLVGEGRIEEAAALHMGAEDCKRLAGLIRTHAANLLGQGRLATLGAWLAALPEDHVGGDPWLSLWAGTCKAFSQTEVARAHLNRAFRLFREAGSTEGQLLAWAGFAETFISNVDRPEQVDPWIDAVVPLLETVEGRLPPALEARVMGGGLWLFMLRRPEHPMVDRCRRRGMALLDQLADPKERLVLAFALGIINTWWRGDSSALDRFILPTDGPITIEALGPYPYVAYRMLQTWLHAVRGRQLESAEALADAADTCRQHGLDAFLPGLYSAGTLLGLVNRDEKAGPMYLALKGPLSPPDMPLLHMQYRFESAWYLAHKGELPQALEHAEVAVQVILPWTTPFLDGLAWHLLAQLHLAMGQLDACRERLDKATPLVRRMDWPIPTYVQHLVETTYALRLDREDTALDHVREAFALGARRRLAWYPCLMPQVLAPACALALEHGIEPEFVAEVIHRRGLRPEQAGGTVAHWPWPVKVHTLGRFAVEVGEAPLAFSGKAQTKPLELLKALVALADRGKAVGTGRLTQALWPDATGDMARQALRTTLHRLRKMIGADAVIATDGRLGLDAGQVWVDLWALEEVLAQAEREDGRGRLALDRMLGFYGGPFLAQEDAGWALGPQERVASRVRRLLVRRGRSLLHGGDHKAAVAVYERAVELEPLSERYYRGLMAAHAAGGQTSEALAAYMRCRRVLAKQLDLLPSKETEALHSAIRNGDTGLARHV